MLCRAKCEFKLICTLESSRNKIKGNENSSVMGEFCRLSEASVEVNPGSYDIRVDKKKMRHCLRRCIKLPEIVLCAILFLGILWFLLDAAFSKTQKWPFMDEGLCQNDPELIAFIQKKYIIQPSVPKDGKPVQPSYWGDPSKVQYSKFGMIEKKLIPLLFLDENGKMMRGGTFLDSGSGQPFLSATLYMERFLGWKGLILEVDPFFIQAITRLKSYNSTLVAACGSPEAYPGKVYVNLTNPEKVHHVGASLEDSTINYIHEGKRSAAKVKVGIADCFPLFSILLAANTTKVDFAYWSFGGKGPEVLGTLPFQEVDIKVILFTQTNDEGYQRIQEIMLTHDYIQVPPKLLAVEGSDVVYVKKDWAVQRKFQFVDVH